MKVRWSYARAKASAERIRQSRSRRAKEACTLAGLDSSIIGIHVHNALCGLRQGRPWKGIDYHYARKARWLMDREWDGYRILERYCAKRDAENRFWISEENAMR